MISRLQKFGGDDVSLVPYAALPTLRTTLISGGADDEHMLVVRNGALHKLRQLITWYGGPLIQRCNYPIGTQPLG
jgi:hypothetical protein